MAGIYLKKLKDKEIDDFLRSFDTVLCDCDGVLWIGEKNIEGVPMAVKKLKDNGKRFFYVTNNCMMCQREVEEKVKKLGYDGSAADITCTSYLVVAYLKSINFQKKVFIVGSTGISQELESSGIQHTGVGPDVLDTDIPTVIANFTPDPEIGAVVVGFDENISYPKILRAATYLQKPGVIFLATNRENQLLGPAGKIPGTGALLASIEVAADRKAIVLGKPEPYVSKVIMENYGLNPERTLFIGDRATTDILLGKRCGFKTLLVLSGVSKEKDIDEWKKSTASHVRELIPDFYTDSLADLSPYL